MNVIYRTNSVHYCQNYQHYLFQINKSIKDKPFVPMSSESIFFKLPPPPNKKINPDTNKVTFHSRKTYSVISRNQRRDFTLLKYNLRNNILTFQNTLGTNTWGT